MRLIRVFHFLLTLLPPSSPSPKKTARVAKKAVQHTWLGDAVDADVGHLMRPFVRCIVGRGPEGEEGEGEGGEEEEGGRRGAVNRKEDKKWRQKQK